jgi:hypothetical protein
MELLLSFATHNIKSFELTRIKASARRSVLVAIYEGELVGSVVEFNSLGEQTLLEVIREMRDEALTACVTLGELPHTPEKADQLTVRANQYGKLTSLLNNPSFFDCAQHYQTI